MHSKIDLRKCNKLPKKPVLFSSPKKSPKILQNISVDISFTFAFIDKSIAIYNFSLVPCITLKNDKLIPDVINMLNKPKGELIKFMYIISISNSNFTLK